VVSATSAPGVPDDFDAIVIGGGPAGSCTARALARLGWRTALIEHGSRHRLKACGDCLNVRGVQMLQRAGLLDDVRALAVGSTRQVRVHVAGRSPLTAPLPAGDAGVGLLVPRDRFDQLLIDRAVEAGVHVFQPVSARVIELTPRGARVALRGNGAVSSARCRLLVGADGLRSAIADAAGLGWPRTNGGKFGFAIDVDGPARGGVAPGTIEMFVVRGGYLGVVTRSDRRMHVAGLVSSGDNPVEFVESVAGRFDVLRASGLHRLRRSSVNRLLGAGPIPCRPRGVACVGVALVGDAAGYVEPFSGDGISCALESAEVLADTLTRKAPGEWTPATARAYQGRWTRRIGRRQHLARLLARMLERPDLTGGLVSVTGRYPPIAAWLVRMAVGP
jgi:flavin-dependent dehydrogenase